MKKVKKPYKNSTINPSLQQPSSPISNNLSLLLPTTILTLTLSLSPQDKEILAYLLSKKTNTTHTNHSPLFTCTCFKCYITYWLRWDSSPNRHLIHQIIDAVEDNGLMLQTHKHKSKKDRKNKPFPTNNMITTTTTTAAAITNININDDDDSMGCDESEGVDGAESTRTMEVSQPSVNEFEGGTVMRKLVSFIGQRMWSVWT